MKNTQSLYNDAIYEMGTAQRRRDWALKHGTHRQQNDAQGVLNVCSHMVQALLIMMRIENKRDLGMHWMKRDLLIEAYESGNRGIACLMVEMKELQAIGLIQIASDKRWIVTDFGQKAARYLLDGTS